MNSYTSFKAQIKCYLFSEVIFPDTPDQSKPLSSLDSLSMWTHLDHSIFTALYHHFNLHGCHPTPTPTSYKFLNDRDTS